MKNTITETTRLLLQGNLTKEEADKILLDLHNVSKCDCGSEYYHTYKCVNTKCDNCVIYKD